MVEPKIKIHHKDIPIDLTLVELNDGNGNYKNEFENQEEAIHFLRNTSDIKTDREYIIIPSCKVRFP